MMPTQMINQENHANDVRVKTIYSGDVMIAYIKHNITLEDFTQEMVAICRFPPDQVFTMKWVDEEGDPCTISTQLELDEALRLYEINRDSELTVHAAPLSFKTSFDGSAQNLPSLNFGVEALSPSRPVAETATREVKLRRESGEVPTANEGFDANVATKDVTLSNVLARGHPQEVSDGYSNAKGVRSPKGLNVGYPAETNVGYPKGVNFGYPVEDDVERNNVGYTHKINVGYPKRLNVGFPKGNNVGYPEDISAGYPKRLNVGYSKENDVRFTHEINFGYPEDIAAGYPKRLNVRYPKGNHAGYPLEINVGYPKDISAGYPKRLNFGYPNNVGYTHELKVGYPKDINVGYLEGVNVGRPLINSFGYPQGINLKYIEGHPKRVYKRYPHLLSAGYPSELEVAFSEKTNERYPKDVDVGFTDLNYGRHPKAYSKEIRVGYPKKGGFSKEVKVTRRGRDIGFRGGNVE